MPTGYTSAIEDGITFRDFAWRCARNFSALASMRDDPLDAPVPETTPVSTYYLERLEESHNRLNAVQRMTGEEAEYSAEEWLSKEISIRRSGIEKANALKAKYNKMLESVNKWTPPSPDHEGLKTFMIEQIQSSIDYDCDTEYYENSKPAELSGEEWRQMEMARLIEDIQYYTEEQQKEEDRTQRNNEWLRELRESLV